MTKQGTRDSNRLATIEDLDALLARHTLAPTVIRLGGKDYQVRTDLTASEVQRFLTLMGKGLDAQAFTILVGTKTERVALTRAMDKAKAGEDVALPASPRAQELNDYLESLPRMHTALVSGRIMRASKVLAQHAKTERALLAEYDYEPAGDVEPAETVEQGESSAS